MGFSSAGTTTRCESTWRLRYKHGDLVGSNQWLTDENGAVDNPATTLAYTAFGEAVGDDSGAFSRYRYAGGHGYESDLITLSGAAGTAPITLLHVGERWYQTGVGRFVQRDPIGINGGLNVYAYVENCPVATTDPRGLHPEENENSPYPYGIPEEPHPGHDEAVVVGTTGIIIAGCVLNPAVGAIAGVGTIFWAHDEWIRWLWDNSDKYPEEPEFDPNPQRDMPGLPARNPRNPQPGEYIPGPGGIPGPRAVLPHELRLEQRAARWLKLRTIQEAQ